MEIIVLLAILLFSTVVHEITHGLVAEKMGDSTARDAGRITLNPIPHIDPFGSILVPGLLLLMHSPIVFGAAKPVPVNFERLRPQRLGMALVAVAGPVSNFVLAGIFLGIVRLGLGNRIADPILIQAFVINIVLGVFNLLPIPPLDGSKVITAFLPSKAMRWVLAMEQYGFILIIVLLMMGVLDIVLAPVLSLFLKIFGINI